MVLGANPDIVVLDRVGYFEPTGTIEISVITSAADDSVRHAIAFAVTEVLSGLWATGQPLRDPAATTGSRSSRAVLFSQVVEFQSHDGLWSTA